MATDLQLALTGNLKGFTDDYTKSLQKVLTNTVRATANTIRSRVQSQIKRGFTGPGHGARLAKAFVQKNTPKSGYVFAPSSRVYSRALYDAKYGRAEAVDLIDLYTTGGTVRAHDHAWLAIPTKDAPLRGGRGGGNVQAMPSMAGVKLVFVRTRNPNEALLVTTRKGSRPVVAYVLMRMTTRRARLDVDGEVRRATDNVSGFFEKQFAKEDAALTSKWNRGLAKSDFGS